VSTRATTAGTFVWHEQVSADPKRAEDFYTRVLGWGTEVFKPGEFDYTMISAGGHTHGGISKAMEGAPPPHWLSHVQVEDVDETIEKATRASGKLLAGPFEMGEVGRMAIISDPQGAFVSAYQPRNDGAAPEGVFAWDELVTTDVDGAQRFYEEVFDWTTEDPGPEFHGYRIFKSGETQVAGMMTVQDQSVPPHWQPYVMVSDVDATAATALELGSSALIEPMNVPGVGRIALLLDPQGAIFGVMKPLAQS
jgi:uncharacterized protein